MYQAIRHSTPVLPEALENGLRIVREQFSVLDRVLGKYGALSVADYVATLFETPSASLQKRSDFTVLVADMVSKVLGPEIAAAAAEQLATDPVVLTANHHGLDTFAQSLQTNLLFSMCPHRAGKMLSVVPVLACGNVPLNNLTYPRGLLVYGLTGDAAQSGMMRLPLFPDKYKRRMVSRVSPFDQSMVERLQKRLETPPLSHAISPRVVGYLQQTLATDFKLVAASGHLSYSAQATHINALLWRNLFSVREEAPVLLYIELEQIAAHLLLQDLLDQDSLASTLLFDGDVRSVLLEQLNGVQGCWTLTSRSAAMAGVELPSGDNGGTLFFWGVDESGLRVALAPDISETGEWTLRGTGQKGGSWSVPLTAVAISDELKAGRIIPSLFTSYMLLSLARGITCIGGYYQAAYLPEMQRGVVEALCASTHHNGVEKAKIVSRANTDKYLSGMQTVTVRAGDRRTPAGFAEIAAAGGLARQHLRSMAGVTVLDAHIASLADTLIDAKSSCAECEALIADVISTTERVELANTVTLALDD
ncbi:MAG: hypothetical protein KDI83_20390 [Gammaproteobacteria bacterium]|nr:hypothetical protein [Gammaproteobacteria bacterium]